jgi:propanol-preferring alcohol dehydrogenase
MDIAPKIPVRTTTQRFALEQANEALDQLRRGRLKGAAILACD